jgi:septal ring factor EnvC (AmiA/AmiB activator)
LPERARTEALARRAAERLQALQREADRLTSDERTLLGDLRKLEIERQIKAEELKRVDADAARVQTELDESSARMEALEASASAEIPELQQRLVEIYKLGQARYLRLLLSTPDLRRLGQSTRTVAALAKLDRDRVATHATTLAALKKERQALAARGAELAGLRAGVQKAQAAAQRAAQAKTDLIRDIDKRRDLNAQLSGELQAAQQKIQATLRDLATAGPRPMLAAVRPSALDWPMAGSVVRRFDAVRRRTGSKLPMEGASALAVHDVPSRLQDRFRFGNLVIVDTAARTQCTAICWRSASRKVPGSITARRSGMAGRSRRARTAFTELRVDGQPVDPLQWLKKR